jgi:hypothetical protein
MANLLMSHGVDARVQQHGELIYPYYRSDTYRESSPADMVEGGQALIDFVSWYPDEVLYQVSLE